MIRAADLVKAKGGNLSSTPGNEDDGAKVPASQPPEVKPERIEPAFRMRDLAAMLVGDKTSPMPPQREKTVEAPIQRTQETKVASPGRAPESPESATAPAAPLASPIPAPVLPKSSLPAAEAVAQRAPDKAAAIRGLYLSAQAYLREVRENVRANRPFSIEPAVQIIHAILDSGYDVGAEIYSMTVEMAATDEYSISHAVNIMIYSLKIGQRLNYSREELVELGLSALLCDVGMFKIPESILGKQGKLSASEIDVIKSHPAISREILLPLREKHPAIVQAVYEHQERENGQGYPRGIPGDEICEYAKIIGLCDSYEAMTHYRPHRKAIIQTDTIKELIGTKNQLFSPRIIKIFLDVISIFPIGSFVRLNNRKIGRVVATSSRNPLKPIIVLLYDENGKAYPDPQRVDLMENPVLNVESGVNPEDLRG